MKLIVLNLPRDLSEDELTNLFEDFGQIKSSNLVLDTETGKSKGFGFVEMTEQNDAEAAIEELQARDGAAVGTVVASMSDSIPDGYLLCDGSSLDQADYPELYAVIGEQFGSEDSTSFNLPDLRGGSCGATDPAAGSAAVLL